jgi:hypothetical protein
MAAEPDTFWGTTATVAVSIAAFTQMMLFSTGAYFIMEYAKKNKAELQLMPIDKDVEAYEAKARHSAALHAHVTSWHLVPIWLKATLVIGAFCMTLASYAFGFYPDLCFLPYDLTNSIKCDLGGNIMNILLLDGQYAMGLLFVSIVCLQVFQWWAGRRKAALTEAEKKRVIREMDKTWKAVQRRLSETPFMHDEAPHQSWRENSKAGDTIRQQTKVEMGSTDNPLRTEDRAAGEGVSTVI